MARHTISEDEAQQFAMILLSGVPEMQAMVYLRPAFEGTPPDQQAAETRRWMTDDLVQRHVLRLQGKSWQARTTEEKIRYAIDKHYIECAYFLYSHNYAELEGHARMKADTCRQVLEAKLAGMSGKMNALEAFWQDVQSGRVQLGVSKPADALHTDLITEVSRPSTRKEVN